MKTKTKKPAKKIDDVRYSKIRVLKRWFRNMKHSIDPALTGAKWGVMGVHSIPTLVRHYKEGRMSTEHPWASIGSMIVSSGAMLTGYGAAAHYISRTAEDPEWGAIIAAPVVAAQGMSWVSEALVNAHRTEISSVVMTNVQRAIQTPSEAYDLSCHDMVKALEERLVDQEENKICARTQKYSVPEPDYTHKKDRLSARYPELEDYKEKANELAQVTMMYFVRRVLNGLMADGALGKTYDMSRTLEVGPKKRGKDQDLVGLGAEILRDDFRKYSRRSLREACDIMAETVPKGSKGINIELLGQVTSVYNAETNTSEYRVTPNHIWKV